VEKVQHLVDDVVTYAGTVHAANPDLPRFLFGHSMGGLVSLKVCVSQPNLFQYAIFSAPSTSRPPTVNPVLAALGGVVGKLGPRLRLTPLDKSTLCRNAASVQAYEADPMIWHQNIAVGFGADILATGAQLLSQANLSQFTIPSLFLSGSADTIVNPAGSLKFFQNCASPDKTYLSLDGWFHELLNEPEADQLMPFITDWIKERLALAPGAVLATNTQKIGSVNEGQLSFQLVP